jgi:hypothetical protein
MQTGLPPLGAYSSASPQSPLAMQPSPATPGFASPAAVAPTSAPMASTFPRPISVGGVMNVASAGAVIDAARKAAELTLQTQQSLPEVTGLAGYVKKCWAAAKQAKLKVEQEMLEALQARRGEYTAEKRAKLIMQGGSQIFMMVTSTKCRGAGALISDVVIGTGADKGWTLEHTPIPDLPGDVQEKIIGQVAQEVIIAEQLSGQPVDEQTIRDRLQQVYDDTQYMLDQEARKRTERMEKKMEDQLIEGGYLEAMAEFVDDLTTYKNAFLKGPIIRRKPKLVWGQDAKGEWTPNVTYELVKCWERVDPFAIYPAPWAKNINDAYLIEKHKLTRTALAGMIGVPGYSEEAIRKTLDLFGNGGLHDWLSIEAQVAFAEGRDQSALMYSDTIDALQFMGSVSGKMLLEYGMDKAKVPDPAKEYEAEVWLIGPNVIKCTLNPDPLCRRGYYTSSYESIPGAFWGNSLYDLIKDCQDMCNAAARALANNLGIASGPQVGVNVDRLPTGEKITQMYPWKIWQFTSDPMGNTTQPAIQFFNPDSHAQELMIVFEKYATLADEYSGVPRYMTGNEGTPGAGRTASGLSMMINNASKIIKNVIGAVDIKVTTQMLEVLHYQNMRYGTDPALKGDLRVKARGVLAFSQREAAQLRRNEFLTATNNPADLQIMGPEGRAYLLREVVKDLDVDADKVVPSPEAMRRRQVIQAAMAASQAAGGVTPQPGGATPVNGNGGNAGSRPKPPGSGQTLMNGAPTVDNFQPA